MTLSSKSLVSVTVAPENRYQIVRKDAGTWDIHESDGKTEWIWYPWRKEYVEQSVERSSDPEALSPGESGIIAWLRQIDKKLASGRVQPPQTIDTGHGRVNCMVIIGPPPHQQHDPTMQQQTTYWIDRDRKILVKEQFVMRSTVPEHKFHSEGTTIYTTELNASFADSLFKFVPPVGTKKVEKIEFGRVELGENCTSTEIENVGRKGVRSRVSSREASAGRLLGDLVRAVPGIDAASGKALR
jgi:hypothetical protein